MNRNLKCFLLISIFSIFLIGTEKLFNFLPILQSVTQKTEAEVVISEKPLTIFQENSLLPITNLFDPKSQVIQKIKVVITAYSSTPWETDDSPFITAAGTQVREGIVANNLLPFGTEIRIPELYGNKIFVVEDRMNWKKGNYHIDIWFPSHWEAKNFGAKRALIEVLEN